MTTISGICRDAAGDPVAGRSVRVDRLDTGGRLGSAVSSDGSAIEGDDHYDNVLFLLNMNGTDGSTSFSDTGPSARSVSAIGATITTTKAKFGASCGNLTSGSKYLEFGSHADFVLGTDDFTFETFVWLNGSQSNASILDFGAANSAGSFALFFDGSSLKVRIDGLGNDLGSYTPSSGELNTWVHLAVVRASGVITCYLNGASIFSGTRAQNITQNTPRIGTLNGFGFYINAWIDSARLTKGVARYISAFTPMTAEPPETPDIPATLVGSYEIDCGSYTGDVIVYQYDPADLTIRPQIHISTPV